MIYTVILELEVFQFMSNPFKNDKLFNSGYFCEFCKKQDIFFVFHSGVDKEIFPNRKFYITRTYKNVVCVFCLIYLAVSSNLCNQVLHICLWSFAIWSKLLGLQFNEMCYTGSIFIIHPVNINRIFLWIQQAMHYF